MSDLETRLARVEEVLIKAGLLKKEKQIGDDVTDASWDPFRMSGGILHYNVGFKYACPCGEIHDALVQIKPYEKDGLEREVAGPCGEKQSMRVWKDKKF
jgi:hypothetical protein